MNPYFRQQKQAVKSKTVRHLLTRSCRFCQCLKGRTLDCLSVLSSSREGWNMSASSYALGWPSRNKNMYELQFRIPYNHIMTISYVISCIKLKKQVLPHHFTPRGGAKSNKDFLSRRHSITREPWRSPVTLE